MADLRISQLPPLAGALLQAADPLAVADLSASETKQVTVKDLVQAGVSMIDPGSIPGDKLSVAIPAKFIGTRELADDAVTEAKLANQSTAVIGATQPASGAYIGQLAVVTGTPNALSVWDGGGWRSLSQAIATITGGTIGPVTTNVTVAGTAASVQARIVNSTGAAQFVAGPATTAGSVTLRGITSDDLPKATNALRGAVSVPVGSGLTINGGGSGLEANIEIDNAVTASAVGQLVTYNNRGLVTGGRAVLSSDLPLATAGSTGVIAAGVEFSVDVSGVMRHVNQLAAGSATKVQYDQQGHVTGALPLVAGDIPALNASKITTGAFDSARIANGSLTKDKFANYATTVIQEADPGAGDYIGQFWYRESDAQLRTWSANSWIPVGFGRLSQENLRFCGTFNAATGSITQVTTFGTAAGLKAGAAIPAATEPLTGAYLVATTPGTYNGDVYDNGDWALCIGTQWIRVDTLSSAGGGSTINLGDLLNVTLTTPQSGDSLIFDASTNTWKNRSTHGVKINLIEAFDGVRTSFTTSRQVVSENNLIVSVGGVIQEPGVDFTAPTGGSTINFLTAPPAGSDHWILQEASLDGGGGGGGTTLPPGTAAEEYLKWSATLLAWQPSNTLEGGSF